MLDDIIGKLSGGIAFLGGALVVWGGIRLGTAVKDGATGGGREIAEAVSMMVAGGIIIACSVYFGMLDTSWAK